MPLLLIGEVINKFKDIRYFNKLDYLKIQQCIDSRRQWIKRTNKRLFKPKVIYFGLYSSLEIFQQIINSIFWDLLHKGALENYIDVIVSLDINIFLFFIYFFLI